MKMVVLRKGRDWSVRHRHPWVFSGAIDEKKTDLEAPGPAEAGAIVGVVSDAGETLGYGWYSPASQIRVRMLSFDAAVTPDDAFVRTRVADAVARRAEFLSGAYTNAVRLVNAESDGLPGVVVDVYAGFAVCQFTSAGADRHKGDIAAALMASVPGCRGVSERTDLKDREKEGLAPAGVTFRTLAGEEPPALIEIFEGPCKFLVDVRAGHKTGFYLDQRDARSAVGALAKGAEVLNCFSYTGGFGLFARANGAAKVTQVDISGEALALAERNAALTEAPGTVMEHVAADVFQFLRTCRDQGRRFDLIVLDPPKFAAVKSQLQKAARGYKDINLLAMKLLKPGGTLATFSCSGAMTEEFFLQVLGEAATDAKRDFQVVGRTRQGADHPVALGFPEGLYLKGVILRSLT